MFTITLPGTTSQLILILNSSPDNYGRLDAHINFDLDDPINEVIAISRGHSDSSTSPAARLALLIPAVTRDGVEFVVVVVVAILPAGPVTILANRTIL